MSSSPGPSDRDAHAAANKPRRGLLGQLDEIRAELSDMAYDVSDAGVRSLLNEAKDRLAMAQDLIEAANV